MSFYFIDFTDHNSIFQTMENARKHRNIELIHNETRLEKISAKPTYKTSTIFNEDLVAAELYRTYVKLFKPIYCGMAILGICLFIYVVGLFILYAFASSIKKYNIMKLTKTGERFDKTGFVPRKPMQWKN